MHQALRDRGITEDDLMFEHRVPFWDTL
jgi:hypothetical protein